MAKIDIRKKTNSPTALIICGLIFSILLIASSVFLMLYPFPSKEKVSYFKKTNPIIFQANIYGMEALMENEQLYIPYSFLKENIDPSAVIDEKSQSMIITTKDKVIQLPNERLEYFINDEPFLIDFPVIKNEQNEFYVAIEPLLSIYPLEVNFHEDTGAVIIKEHKEVVLPAKLRENVNVKNLRLRTEPSVTQPYVSEIKQNEQVYIESEDRGFYFVRQENGIAGYLPKDSLILKMPYKIEVAIEERERVPPLVEWPIHLTWEAVYSKNPDTKDIPDMPGVNVVSPTWFTLKNGNGEIDNMGDNAYVKWAKNKDLQIWALFSNGFEPERTHVALKDFETRKKVIRQLLQFAQMYKLDGINIDFENVNVEDKDLVTQFVRELTVYLHQAGLVVSMDITFISGNENWSMFYDREKLAEIVDYLIVMAYDEHWGSSPIAGSVASLPWVENNLKNLLEVVPNERLMLGVPFYTRIWKEQATDGGNIEVSSKAYSMDYVEGWLKDNELTPILDEASGQMYAEYYDEKEKATYKVWIEDNLSMKKRVQLVHKYQLAGTASWNRFFANEGIWTDIETSLNQFEPATNIK